MLFEYLSLFALVVIQFVPEFREIAEYFLAGSLLISSSMFYLLMLNSILGLQEIGLNTDIDLNRTWQSRVIVSMAAAGVYLIGFTQVFYFVLPFLIIGVISDIAATLIVAGIIEIEEIEYEEDDEEEEDDDKDKPDK